MYQPFEDDKEAAMIIENKEDAKLFQRVIDRLTPVGGRIANWVKFFKMQNHACNILFTCRLSVLPFEFSEFVGSPEGGQDHLPQQQQNLDKKLGLCRILIWPDIRPIILPGTGGYPAGYQLFGKWNRIYGRIPDIKKGQPDIRYNPIPNWQSWCN